MLHYVSNIDAIEQLPQKNIRCCIDTFNIIPLVTQHNNHIIKYINSKTITRTSTNIFMKPAIIHDIVNIMFNDANIQSLATSHIVN